MSQDKILTEQKERENNWAAQILDCFVIFWSQALTASLQLPHTSNSHHRKRLQRILTSHLSCVITTIWNETNKRNLTRPQLVKGWWAFISLIILTLQVHWIVQLPRKQKKLGDFYNKLLFYLMKSSFFFFSKVKGFSNSRTLVHRVHPFITKS